MSISFSFNLRYNDYSWEVTNKVIEYANYDLRKLAKSASALEGIVSSFHTKAIGVQPIHLFLKSDGPRVKRA